MAVCLFKAINDFLLTKERMVQKQIIVDPICVLCNKHIETIDHLFFQCDFSEKIWLWSCKKNFTHPKRMLSFYLKDDLQKIVSSTRAKNLTSDLLHLSISVCVWHIWRERNERIFQNRFTDQTLICTKIFQTMNIRMVKSKFYNNITDTKDTIARKWGYTSQR